MPIKTGFAEADISPPPGTMKLGWIKEIVIDRALDPIFARAAVLETPESSLAFVQLDLLCIQWEDVSDLRRRIEERYGFPGEAVMVAATHNHAGPAVMPLGEVPRDAAYVESMIEKAVAMFGEALASLTYAQVGIASVHQWHLSHNRRMVMRDGTVQTHTGYGRPDALYVEGPIDPEVAVLAARDRDGKLLGALVNFACHPTHHGGDTLLSGGFPGALAREMKARNCPVTLFLNGAAGNLSSGDPLSVRDPSPEEMGKALADDAFRAISIAKWREAVEIGARTCTLPLPFRAITDAEIRGTTPGAQRFIDPAIYDRAMPELVERIRREGHQPAEVQAFSLDEFSFVSVPAELFVQLGLRVKEQSAPRRALIVGFANGYVGYVPHREAFARGGYETTFSWGSNLAHEAGEMLADGAIELARLYPGALRRRSSPEVSQRG
ncbi:MAG: hypothetical protein KY468_14845 [Armatimonadetes bacterium]|nr:hypothetical protein [Armatimonadota bacterium]